MKKIDKQDIFYAIWFLILLALEITLLVVIILDPKEQLVIKIIAIIFTSISLLLAAIGEGYSIYSLTSSIISIRKSSKEK